jgi:hypothetical protein
MARVRSPGYPNAALPEVIEFARLIHEADRQHPVSREVAAQHMGFSGSTGSSDRAISALMHFGLAEKVVKGEIRVTDLALRIIHPDSAEERRAALREAAFRPDLFQELRERYPGPPPSASTLASYLSRSNFAGAAIGPASKAYLETCYYLQREHAYESEDGPSSDRAESAPVTREEPITVHETQSAAIAAARQMAVQPRGDLPLNSPNFDIRGGTVVHVEGLLDLQGLADLEKSIAALKMLLKPRTVEAAPTGPGENEPSH